MWPDSDNCYVEATMHTDSSRADKLLEALKLDREGLTAEELIQSNAKTFAIEPAGGMRCRSSS